MWCKQSVLTVVLLMLVGAFRPSVLGSQTPRRPVPISEDSTLRLRVLVRPLSHIYKAKESKEVVKENVPTFQAYYVYTRPENRQGNTEAPGWYQVGSNDRGD